MVLEIAVAARSNLCKVSSARDHTGQTWTWGISELNNPKKQFWVVSSTNPSLRILPGVVQNFTGVSHRPWWATWGTLSWGTCWRGGFRSVTVPTWAEGDVAELGLFLGALAGVPPELRWFAGAGPVPVASPTGGRAQAPWRPLIPGAMHCKGSRKCDFFWGLRKWGSPQGTASSHPEWAVCGKLENRPAQDMQEEHQVIFVLCYQHQVSAAFQSLK